MPAPANIVGLIEFFADFSNLAIAIDGPKKAININTRLPPRKGKMFLRRVILVTNE
jgi:hypothetical protein